MSRRSRALWLSLAIAGLVTACGGEDDPAECAASESSRSALVEVAPRLEDWVESLKADLADSCRSSVWLLGGELVFSGGDPLVGETAAACQQTLDLLGLTRLPEPAQPCSADFTAHATCEVSQCGLIEECVGDSDRCVDSGSTPCALVSPPACAVEPACELACTIAGRLGSTCDPGPVSLLQMEGVDVIELAKELTRWRALDAKLLLALQSAELLADVVDGLRTSEACGSASMAEAELSAQNARDTASALVFSPRSTSARAATP